MHVFLYFQLPSTQEEWLQIARQCEEKWNYPHCLGAFDGKHVVLQAPFNSGSDYYNYQGDFSIVLFALVDADYNFLFADIGCQGRISDGGVFKNSKLWKLQNEKKLCIPEPASLPHRQKDVPYVFLGDEAFALTENVMKPFSGDHNKGTLQRIYNYRHSRMRRVVENTFGIQSSVFRVLRKPMLLQPEKAAVIVASTVYLHNFLRKSKTSASIYTPSQTLDVDENGQFIPSKWRQEQQCDSWLPLRRIPRKSGGNALQIRNEFGEYFMTDGRVEWQDKYA